MRSAAALVAADKEPITPFIAKIRALVSRGVSCILVMGGAGDYFGVRSALRCNLLCSPAPLALSTSDHAKTSAASIFNESALLTPS